MPLKIAAKVDKADRDYFDEQIRPLIEPAARRVSSARSTMRGKSEFLSGAIALLVPIDWPEPFGLVMIEAMACGTPVIAFNRGSVPEIIEDGLTGYIVEDEISAVGAIGQLSALSRERVRARFDGAVYRPTHGQRISWGLSTACRDPAPAIGECVGPAALIPSRAASPASASTRERARAMQRSRDPGMPSSCRTGRSGIRPASC